MKQKRSETKDDEFFFDLLKDQFVFFYALTNVAIEAYKSARESYSAKVCLDSRKKNRQVQTINR